MSFKYYEDPILGKGRAQVDTGSGGSGGAEYLGGYRITIAGGTISNDRYMPIESVTGNSVTMQAGHAYKVYATASSVTLNTETVPEGKFGLEGHLEIYVAGTGYVVTGSNVVLANALEPDSVNNCTVRFHDGLAIISVEDHVAGYIVVNGSTSGEGSLYYGISTSTNDYVAFDASLNGTVIPLAGAVAEGEKHVVGNGYSETAISGNIDCSTNKVTVANLSLQDVGITGGTLTLGDAFIPSGSTVAVSGGGLAVEKVSGNGGVIDLGGTHVVVSSGTTASASGCTFSGGSKEGNGGGLFNSSGTLLMTNCTLSGNSATGQGGAIYTQYTLTTLISCTLTGNSANNGGGLTNATGATTVLSDCIVSGNTVYVGGDIRINAGKIEIIGGTIGKVYHDGGGVTTIAGNCSFTSLFGSGGTVTISSGAIIDLTGNTNSTPIAPGGGITFEKGGATVLYSSGAVSGSYMIDNVTLPEGAKLTNTNEVMIANDTVISGSALLQGVKLTRTNGGVVLRGTNALTVSDCMVQSPLYTDTVYGAGGTVILKGGVSFSSNGGCFNIVSSYGSGSVIISSGAVINLAGVISSVPIAAGGGVIVDGGCQVVTGAGTTVSIAGGTYTKINNDGTTE